MKVSAGILLYRKGPEGTEFFLVHPGGPFFAKKQEGWWTIPKGEPTGPEEGLWECAVREFAEETGFMPQAPFTALQPVTQKGGKTVYCWAAEGNVDPETCTSNTFEMEWPPKSGQIKNFPEIDKAGWFGYEEAKILINDRQAAFLDELQGCLSIAGR